MYNILMSTSASVKIHAYIAQAGVTSRRKAEEMVAEGRVKVNSVIATIGQRITPESDQIEVDGKLLNAPQTTEVYLIYKPVGIISSTHDELNRETVVDFLQKQVGPEVKLPRLYPVGRLDQDSEGLMILTNDGDLTYRLTHPSQNISKTYHVTVGGHPTFLALDHLRKGVRLREGYTSPAEVQVLKEDVDTTTVEITIHEGRYHQIKRMMLRVGYEVIKLVRVQMGDYTLESLQGQSWIKIK
jgi:23S rRNA pseudouridine2605 synthase